MNPLFTDLNKVERMKPSMLALNFGEVTLSNDWAGVNGTKKASHDIKLDIHSYMLRIN